MTTCARCGAELTEGVRFCSACGAAVAQGGLQAPVRKHVVTLFCDIVGSTTLGESADPEALRERLARYFDAVSQVIWAHGGTVEKFIGDAVMAVFGVPSTREDDAARAVRAASGIHDAVAGLSAQFEREIGTGLHVRIGVNSGEVFVAHQPDGQFSVTGDAVNTAQRLEAAAGTDETYVGGTVAELVSGEIVLDEVGEILHKGKTVPQQVFRVAVDQDRVLEVREPAFVGRVAELADLAALAVRSAACQHGWLLTYVGEAGIGKSRLIRQFAADRAELRVVVGRCDAMNTGAFAPLTSWLGNLADDWQAYVEELLTTDAKPALHRFRSAVGLSDAQTSIDDVVWAVHTVLAAVCESTPVAVVWDDLHAATPAQLRFVNGLAVASRTLPVLTICLARPELFDVDESWGGGRKSRVEDVDPLDYEDMLAIAAERIAIQAKDIDVTAEDLVNRADGNPQVVQLLAQSAAAGEALPASVTQLYEAALDRLTPDERVLAETAAVYGREFPVGPVAAVAGVAAPIGVIDRLRARNVLEVAGDGRYRFAQTVFAQTAYRTMPKRTRIARHSELAEWIAHHRDTIAADTVALVASHRRRAFELAREIGAVANAGPIQELAAAAAMDALRVMQLRGDPAIPDALDQALDVLPVGDPRHLELAYAALLARSGGAANARWYGWLDRIDRALTDDATWQAVRLAPRHQVATRTGELALDDAVDETRRMRKQLTDGTDPYAIDLAATYLAQVEADLGHLSAAHQICLEGVASAANDGRVVSERVWRNFDLQISNAGSAPVDEVIADARRLQQDMLGHRGLWGTTTAVLAGALASTGRFEAAQHEWELHRSTFAEASDGSSRLGRAYDLQHYGRTLLAEGRVIEAVSHCLELSDEVIELMPSFAASLRDTAARDALLAGDLTLARHCVGQALTVQLPDTLSWQHLDAQAFTAAVEAALRGDRDAAFEQIEVGSRIDRPAESLMAAGFVHTFRAIVELLLGDEPASRAARAEAKAAFDRKGAVAFSGQVNAWVGNAGELRTANG